MLLVNAGNDDSPHVVLAQLYLLDPIPKPALQGIFVVLEGINKGLQISLLSFVKGTECLALLDSQEVDS